MIANKIITDTICKAWENCKNNEQQINNDPVAEYSLTEVPITDDYILIIDYERISEEYMEEGERTDTRLEMNFSDKEGAILAPCDIDYEDDSENPGSTCAWYSEYGRNFPSKRNIHKAVVKAMKDFKKYIA